MHRPSWKVQLAFAVSSGVVFGFLLAQGDTRAVAAGARVFWAFFGFSQGYLVCWWTPHVSDFAAPRIGRWLERRRQRRGK